MIRHTIPRTLYFYMFDSISICMPLFSFINYKCIVYVCTYIYIYIYMCIYIYICILYIYIYICACVCVIVSHARLY